jgi:very-short-patch-repair endonuclease
MVGAADQARRMRGADRMKLRIVMRFWNNDVPSNRDGMLTLILEALLQESCV